MVFIDDKNTITYLLPKEDDISSLVSFHDESSLISQPKSAKTAWVLKESFLDSNQNALKKGDKIVAGNFNVLSNKNKESFTTPINLYENIVFENLYKKIDLVLVNEGKTIEKVFKINKNGNSEDIKIKIEGADSLSLSQSGELIIHTQDGNYALSKPIAWQDDIEKTPIDIEYWYDGIFYGFKIGQYDKNQTIYIDPEIVSTYLGKNTYNTSLADISSDSEGNVFVVGSVKYSSYPVVAGSYDITFDGYDDGIVSKLDSSLTTLLSSTFLNGSSASKDIATRVNINSNNDVIVGLETSSSTFPVTANAYDTSYNGGGDTVIAILSNNLSELKYSTFIGGSGNETLRDIKFDVNGNIIIVGKSSYDVIFFPTTPNAYQTINKRGADAYISILSSDLSTLVSSTFIGAGNQH